MSGIYSISILGSSKVYVGQSHDLRTREKDHFYKLLRGKHYNASLQREFDKTRSMSFRILIRCSSDREILCFYEQLILDSCGETFNIRRECVWSPLGLKQTEEANAKRSAALKGYKRTPEEIAKSAAARTGKKRSAETRARLSAAGMGRKLSPEHRAKSVAVLDKYRTGRGPISAETRIRMRIAARNRQKT